MLRTGSICLSFLYNYITENNDKDIDELQKKHKALVCLSKTFENYGGVLAKIAQIISYGEGNSDNTVFDECKPYNSKLTTDFICKLIKKEPFASQIFSFNEKVFKSGSIGQVHKATLFNSSPVVFKVQYFGLQEQSHKDLKILEQIIHFLYNNQSALTNAIIDIKDKLADEFNYSIEAFNQTLFYKLWLHDDSVIIPKIIPSLCTDKVLCTEFVDGETLHNFITDSTQEERNFIGYKIYEFIFTNLFHNKLFYSDIHYGNFIIQNKNTLCVMDFGCINFMDDILITNITRLVQAVFEKNENAFFEVVYDLKIINDKTSIQSKDYLYSYISLLVLPFVSDDFTFTNEWLLEADKKNLELMKEWYLPPNMVYLNKIPYGLVHIFVKLKLQSNFLQLFYKLKLL
jgi:predicted unusual protein kinase regulating ubiquinone biosynthesis (AarF/ABC1/UbiB family)